MKKSRKGFTLIELLIVVAIIAILAAIAIPNFLEAQMRAKIARERADLRSLAVAMEAYFVDYTTYCRDCNASFDSLETSPDKAFNTTLANAGFFIQCANGLIQLTTPIGYINTFMKDPFGGDLNQGDKGGAISYRVGSGSWSYVAPLLNTTDNQKADKVFVQVEGAKSTYVLFAVGPDNIRNSNSYLCFPFMSTGDSNEGNPGEAMTTESSPKAYVDYDPTNGTTSPGDIHYFGGGWTNLGRFLYNGATIGRPNQLGGGATDVW